MSTGGLCSRLSWILSPNSLGMSISFLLGGVHLFFFFFSFPSGGSEKCMARWSLCMFHIVLLFLAPIFHFWRISGTRKKSIIFLEDPLDHVYLSRHRVCWNVLMAARFCSIMKQIRLPEFSLALLLAQSPMRLGGVSVHN